MPKKLKNELPPLRLSNSTIGERIAKYRNERGLTQKELAQRIGITHNLVSDYETGRIHLNDEMVVRFALVFKVSADLLLGLKMEEMTVKPSLKIIRRLQKIEKLTLAEQKALLKTIDMALQKVEGKVS
jgi:transcriptional regulator with XRE-family HTH domain